MCVLSIKVPLRKKSGNLLCAPCIYIYMYINASFGSMPVKLLTIFYGQMGQSS